MFCVSFIRAGAGVNGTLAGDYGVVIVCLSRHSGPVAGTMSEGERQPAEAVFTQLQRGNLFVDTVGVFSVNLSNCHPD